MKSRDRIFVGVMALSVMALSLSSCTKKSATEGAQSTSASETEILIGEVGSMSGSEAGFGQSTHRGIQLAIDQVNAQGGVKGKRLKLLTMDDQGKALEATLAVTKLASSDHVRAILGEVVSSVSIAMAPLAQSHQVPMISPSSINSKLTQQGDYIFRVCFVDKFQSHVMSEFAAKNLGAKKAALLRDSTSDYSVDSARIFAEDFKKTGGEIVIDQSYSGGQVDFKSQLTAIRAKSPDVIVVPGNYPDIGLIARQLKELGMTAPLLGGDGWDSPKLKEIGGASLDGSYFVSHFSQQDPAPQVQGFVTSYQKAYGEAPDGLAALGFDAAKVLIEALGREKAATGPALRDALASTRDYPGVTGKITIGPDHNAVKSAVVFKISGGGNPSIATVMAP